MTEQTPFTEEPLPGGAHPSEALTPDMIDQAVLVAVIRRDGTTYAVTSSDANRETVAAWLHGLAEAVLAADIDCPDCRAGAEHAHPEE